MLNLYWCSTALAFVASSWKSSSSFCHLKGHVPIHNIRLHLSQDENSHFKDEHYNGCIQNNHEGIPQQFGYAIPPSAIDFPLTNGKPIRPSKTDLYSSDELLGLLNIHNGLSESIADFSFLSRNAAQDANAALPTLQDLIVQTIQDVDLTSSSAACHNDNSQNRATLKFHSTRSMNDFNRILPNIRAIASDVDGTLLSSDHSLHPITKQAIQKAVEAAFSPIHPLQNFFLATGKTRVGALKSLGPEMTSLLQQTPGVFVQGLYCVDATGAVVFEKKLSRIAVDEAEALAKQMGVTFIAYDGDSLYTTVFSHATHIEEVSSRWGEPVPNVWEGSMAEYKPCFHKILLMCDDPDQVTTEIRPQLEALALSLGCVVTQAIPSMLELLPSGCSKAVGVQKLCEALGLNLSTEVCTIGDAENDLDMIRLAACGVAVGNAAPSVKNVAAVVMDDTNDEGAAGQAIELFGLCTVLELA